MNSAEPDDYHINGPFKGVYKCLPRKITSKHLKGRFKGTCVWVSGRHFLSQNDLNRASRALGKTKPKVADL